MTDILSFLPPSLPGWLGAGGVAGVGFAFARWFLEYVGGRMDKRADRLDADTRFVIESLRAELARVSERLGQAEVRIEDLGNQLDECKHKHAESEARVMQLEAMQQGYGDARQMAQRIISADRVADKEKHDGSQAGL